MMSACSAAYPGLPPPVPLPLRQATLESQFRTALCRGEDVRPLMDLYVRASAALETELEAGTRTTQPWMLPMVYAYYNQQMALLLERVEAGLQQLSGHHQAFAALHALRNAQSVHAHQSGLHAHQSGLHAHQSGLHAHQILPAHQTSYTDQRQSSRPSPAPAALPTRPSTKPKVKSEVTRPQVRKSALCGIPPAGGSTARGRARQLNPVAVRIMTKWYDQNQQHPYPTSDTVDVMADAGQVTPSQVRKWFANKRKRSGTTKTLSEIAASRYRGTTLSLMLADCPPRH